MAAVQQADAKCKEVDAKTRAVEELRRIRASNALDLMTCNLYAVTDEILMCPHFQNGCNWTYWLPRAHVIGARDILTYRLTPLLHHWKKVRFRFSYLMS